MKFDIDRAMAWVRTFDFPRGTGSAGEHRAAELLAERLEKAGWRVNWAVTRQGCRFSTLVMILLLTLLFEEYFLWKALQLSFPALPLVVRAALFFVAFLLIGGLLRLAFGRDGVKIAHERFLAWRSAKVRSPMANVIAGRPSQADRPTRVFILSHLDTPLPVLVREDRACCVVALSLLVCAFLGLSEALSAWFVVGILWVSLLFQVRYWLRTGRPSPGDNRTGLAALAELAEAFPSRLHERVEIRLAAVSGSSTGQLGSLTLADELRRHSPAKPTLVINLDSPGLGPELWLVGTGRGLEVARGAAKDLWIPHRVSRSRFCVLDHRPFQLNEIPAVSLCGDREGTRIEPATLAATAQLVTEITLRWGREGAKAPQALSLPRSFQKPG